MYLENIFHFPTHTLSAQHKHMSLTPPPQSCFFQYFMWGTIRTQFNVNN